MSATELHYAIIALMPDAVPLLTLAEQPLDPSKTLLGNRFLCRGCSMLFIGPSGIGKSSASVQQDICWALGKPAFGIRPTRPLRILCVQAENDDEDIAEMANGICERLNLSSEERETVRRNVVYVSDCSHTGKRFLRMAEQLLRKYGPFDIYAH
jgi:RecA-family ATPase